MRDACCATRNPTCKPGIISQKWSWGEISYLKGMGPALWKMKTCQFCNWPAPTLCKRFIYKRRNRLDLCRMQVSIGSLSINIITAVNVSQSQWQKTVQHAQHNKICWYLLKTKLRWQKLHVVLLSLFQSTGSPILLLLFSVWLRLRDFII